MTKNMTRKGLALGAASAMLISGFTALPASSAGLADTSFVSLAPTTGTEYGMNAADGTTFSMTANEASTVSTGNLKFLVTDSSGVINPGALTTGGDSDAIATTDWLSSVAAINAVTLTTVGVADGEYRIWVDADLTINATTDQVVLAKDTMVQASVHTNVLTFVAPDGFTSADGTAFLGDVNMYFSKGQAVSDTDSIVNGTGDITGTANAGAAGVGNVVIVTAGVADGDYLVYSGSDFVISDATANPIIVMAANTPQQVTVANNAATLISKTTVVGGEDQADNAEDLHFVLVSSLSTVIRHATNDTYVVDSGVSDPATTESLVLVNDGLLSRSVTVQAWMDANTNNLLDSTEYASPVRTVTWTKDTELAVVTSAAPIVGDAAVTATITTTPVLNGNQVLAQDPNYINAKVTRSLDTAIGFNGITDSSNGTANTSSIWNDTAKTFTVGVNMNATTANEASLALGVAVADIWTGIVSPSPVTENSTGISISTTGLVTVTVGTAHGMSSGDKITMVVDANDPTIALAAEATARTVTVTGTLTFTYQVSETTGFPAATAADTALDGGTEYVLATYDGPLGLVDKVGAETYTVQASVLGALQGNIVTTGVIAAAAATTTITTIGSSTVEGASFSAAGTNVVKVAAGTLSVPVTVTVKNSAGDAVGAGRAVALTLASIAGSNTYKVNGKTADTVLTDANGQVAATITTSAGTNAAAATLTATAENIAVADIDLTWETIAYGLIDLSGTEGTLTPGTIDRDIIKLSSYDMNLMVADQWFNVPPAGTYRLQVTGEGVTAAFVTLVDGRATVTATDTGVFGTEMVSDIVLQKLTGSVFGAVGTYNFDANLSTAYGMNVGASTSTLYGTAVVSSVAVAAKALVEIDKRISTTATPAYANNLVLNGMVRELSTSAAKAGSVVTVSGPSNILFEEDKVAKRGSLVFHTDAAGKFELKAYSTTAQTDTVITFTTSDGATGTIKVSFTGTGVGEGTSLVVTMPAAVKPASTFQVKATLQDAYGNAVDTAADRIKVTYTGPGIVYGTLPTETDSTGGFMFSVLLGSNDTGTVSVTVSYDQNGDGDYVDTKDLVVTGTTAITATGVAASETKVNVGSFKGFVALYAKGYKGQKMSAIVAGKWIVVESLASDFERVVRFTGAGYSITTKIYIDGVQIGDAFTTMTK
jgi:hypothetical protein